MVALEGADIMRRSAGLSRCLRRERVILCVGVRLLDNDYLRPWDCLDSIR